MLDMGFIHDIAKFMKTLIQQTLMFSAANRLAACQNSAKSPAKLRAILPLNKLSKFVHPVGSEHGLNCLLT